MSEPSDEQLRRLLDALGEAQRIGMLGPGSLEEAVRRAWAFVHRCPADARTFVDLGTGGGLPGLVLAVGRPSLSGLLVDRRAKRIDLVTRLIGRLAMSDRIRAWAGDVADLPSVMEEPWDVATCRGFGSPSYTARLARPIVRIGGSLLVSEPPDSTGSRWVDLDIVEAGFQLEDVSEGIAWLRRTS